MYQIIIIMTGGTTACKNCSLGLTDRATISDLLFVRNYTRWLWIERNAYFICVINTLWMLVKTIRLNCFLKKSFIILRSNCAHSTMACLVPNTERDILGDAE